MSLCEMSKSKEITNDKHDLLFHIGEKTNQTLVSDADRGIQTQGSVLLVSTESRKGQSCA